MIRHHVEQRQSPTHVLLRCSCGWSRQVSRSQNALARAAKVRSLRDKHLQEAEAQEKKMTTYIVGDDRIEAASARDLVSKMHAASRSPADNDKAWMVEVAERIQMQLGRKVRTSTSDAFVADLIAVGFIKQES